MLYETLRAAARVALHWYYSDVVVQGRGRIPAHGAVLVTANHPNALVDALLVGTTVDRRVLLTAKATLFANPALSMLLSAVGVVPLRRAKDEASAGQSRNELAFQRVTDALRREGVVLIFPEGISHDEPALAPIKTGAARMALEARDAGVRGLRVLPVGLVFEEKERPRSRVLVRVGEPLDVDAWSAEHPSADAAHLTHEINAKLREVTLNFATSERARRAVRLAATLAAIASEPSDLGDESAFALETDIAARVERATTALKGASPALGDAVDRLIARLAALEELLRVRGASLSDARISLRKRHGLRFVARESILVSLALPVAVLGRAMHWLPIQLARRLAVRSLHHDSSKDQPAMRTIILGLGFVLAWYGMQAALVAAWLGIVSAMLWLAVIFVAARVDLMLVDRMHRAWRRARTYLALRGDAQLRSQLLTEIDELLADALSLERRLLESPA